MKILIASDVLLPGGAETFSLRLAQELQQKGHEVFYFVFRRNKINKEFKDELAPTVQLITPRLFFDRFIEKLDGVLFSLGVNYSILRTLYGRSLRKWVKKNSPNIIHSNLFSSDLIVTQSLRKKLVPVIITIHGDYLRYSISNGSIRAIRVKNFRTSFRKVLERISHIICITDKQFDFFKKNLQNYQLSVTCQKIYNGFRLPAAVKEISRKDLNIPENAFIIGMVARGIKEKGWEELILAFLNLNIERLCLLLVGGGDFLEKIKNKYSHTGIFYVGSVINPIDYIRLFDVGCLPSYSENLPSSIVEYLFCSKPVIASDTGEISNMLRIGTGKDCGLLIKVGDKQNMIKDLENQIMRLFNDPILLKSFQTNTKIATIDFEMDTCLSKYESIYDECIKNDSIIVPSNKKILHVR